MQVYERLCHPGEMVPLSQHPTSVSLQPYSHLRPPNLPLPLIHLSLPPALPRRPFNLLHQPIIILRLTLRLQYLRRQRVLLAIPVLQQREQRIEVLCFLCWAGERRWRWRNDAFLGFDGLDLGGPFGERDGLAGSARGEGEEEGLVGAEEVGRPEAEEAGVLGCEGLGDC